MTKLIALFLLFIPLSLPAQAFAITPAERDARIYQYFRAANENVGALACDVTIHHRDVDQAKKKAVKAHDRRRCVICGSKAKLEVDHIRALQNGGSNDLANLSTLCDECHKIKTRLDNSLRRKRDRTCRNHSRH